MSADITPTEQVRNAIIDGVQRLYALSLQGCPSAEVLPLTAQAWVDAIMPRRRVWTAADVPLVQAAFVDLSSRVDRWPAPRQLDIPAPPPPPALPAPLVPRSPEAQAQMARVRESILRVANRMRVRP